jgi:2-polyprenyl-3-methyl-5-hydroxy-6-metoxy-1,4-benzoquinol methylase
LITQNYDTLNDIKIFHHDSNNEDYNPNGLNNLYKQEEKHFWFIARKEFILKKIKNIVKKDEKIIEIGSGTGNVTKFLINNGYENISVGEMHLNGLKYAQSYGIKNCYQFDLLRIPFENEFDSIMMFDVLEHIEKDNLALENIKKALKPNGKLILTIPAHMWLWNRDDAIAYHKRRYNKNILKKLLNELNFEILTIRYFFIFITPLLFLRRILNKDDKSIIKESEHHKEIKINKIINKILLGLSKFENKINKFIPNIFGGSILVIVRKK